LTLEFGITPNLTSLILKMPSWQINLLQQSFLGKTHLVSQHPFCQVIAFTTSWEIRPPKFLLMRFHPWCFHLKSMFQPTSVLIIEISNASDLP
jgi:hypothetical protein